MRKILVLSSIFSCTARRVYILELELSRVSNGSHDLAELWEGWAIEVRDRNWFTVLVRVLKEIIAAV